MPQPRLRDRLAHAHAFIALHADTASLVEYRRMICPQIDSLPVSSRPEQGDFNKALWEGKWNVRGDQMPAGVTLDQALQSRRSHEIDGLYNTGGRLDPVAMAGELEEIFPATEPLMPLSTVQLAFVRGKLRSIGLRAGLTKRQIDSWYAWHWTARSRPMTQRLGGRFAIESANLY